MSGFKFVFISFTYFYLLCCLKEEEERARGGRGNSNQSRYMLIDCIDGLAN